MTSKLVASAKTDTATSRRAARSRIDYSGAAPDKSGSIMVTSELVALAKTGTATSQNKTARSRKVLSNKRSVMSHENNKGSATCGQGDAVKDRDAKDAVLHNPLTTSNSDLSYRLL